MQIIRVDYGRSRLPESMLYPSGAEEKEIPIVFSVFLVLTRTHTILVDAGCDTMPGFEMEDFCGTVAALKKLGYRPEDITDVILTHAHHDHIQGIKDFPHARVYIQQAEYARGKRHIPESCPVHTFAESCRVTEEVTVMCIGGHTEGSCVVEVQGKDTVYVLCGDECYSRENLIKGIPTGSSCCPEKSAAFIEKYTQPGYTCLLCHDL